MSSPTCTFDRTFRRLPDSAWPGGDPPARALVITCVAECLPDEVIGRHLRSDGLLLLRNPGNLVPPFGTCREMEQAVEQAITRRKVRDVVVLGHRGCGIVRQLLDPPTSFDLSLSLWLDHSEAVRRLCAALPPAERLDRAVEWNVTQQLAHLRTHPAIVAGRVRLAGWVHDPASDEMLCRDGATGLFTRRPHLDPAQNHLFHRHVCLRKPPTPFPNRDLTRRYLT